MEKNQKIRLQATVTSEISEMLDLLSKNLGVSRSSVVSLALKRLYDQEKLELESEEGEN